MARAAGPGHDRAGVAAEAERGGRAPRAPAAGDRRRCAGVQRAHRRHRTGRQRDLRQPEQWPACADHARSAAGTAGGG
ncbi:hypothetical protein G6F59_018145 [Rhizopus arrhizus]|nr:hypothetical protein G6F59_018145 [Rhizopus arrhizus]